jgi:F420H(2)-dependent quinone reductase
MNLLTLHQRLYERTGGRVGHRLIGVPSALQPPGWLFNIEAKADVELQVGRQRFAATARVVGGGDPVHPRLWEIVNANNHGRYRRYQTRTTREIPVVVIRPQ